MLSVGRAWVLLALWGLPLFLGPPVFSRDIYSYIGQGLLAHHGLNPYHVAPSALGPGPLLSSISKVWRNTASPYGPLFVMVSRATVTVSGGSLVSQILWFRATELIGVAAIMVSLPRLSRRLGTDPGLALWLGALSPLALFSFIASGHNDALMVGLLVAGVTLAVEGRFSVGIALCALAALIKVPAALAIVFLAVVAVPGRCRHRAMAGGAQGGVDPLRRGRRRDPRGRVRIDLARPDCAARPDRTAACWPRRRCRSVSSSMPSSTASACRSRQSAVVSATQFVCGLLVVAGDVWLLWNVHRLDVVRAIGLALVLFVVGSPTLWPWYLTWGVTLLAATTAQRSRVLAAVAGLAMLVVGAGGSPMLNGMDYVVTAPLLLAGCAWFFWDRHWQTVVMGRDA